MTEAVSSDSTSKQFRSNLISNILFFVVNIIIGIALVPYFKDTLGIAAYGLIPLATSVTSYVMLTINCLNSSVARYLTIDLQRKEYENANITFNTAFFGICRIILILIPVALVIAWFVPDIFNTPDIARSDIFILFSLVFGSALLGIFRSNYMATLFAKNRLDYRNQINILNVVVQVGLIIALFSIIPPNLKSVGIAYFIAAVFSLVFAIYLSHKVCPEIKVEHRKYRPQLFCDISKTAFWLVVTDIGVLLCTNCSIIVVNLLFGAETAGEYAIVVTWNTLMRSISTGVFGTLFTPLFYSYYARGDISGLTDFSRRTTKLLTIVIALPLAFTCVFAPQLLTLWVGAEMAHLSGLMWLLVAYLIVVLPTLPIYSLLVAFNKVRVAGIVTFFTGIINFILAFTLPHVGGLGVYGVGLAESLVLSARCITFVPWYIAYVIKAPLTTYVRAMIPGICCFTTLAIGGYTITSIILVPSSILVLLGIGICVSLVYLIVVVLFILDAEDVSNIISVLPKPLLKKFPQKFLWIELNRINKTWKE